MKQVRKILSTLVLIFSPMVAQAFDDLRPQWNLDFLYHYARLERATLLRTDNFQSRQGGMLQFEYEDQLDLFWRWYLGGDFTYAGYEASASTAFSPQEQLPWQAFVGTAFQIGNLKSFEVFLGLGGSSEFYFINNGVNSFSFESDQSFRAHLGFSWRFLSMVGSSSKLSFRYSVPVSDVDHNGTPLRFKGVLDGTLRLRSRYDSTFSLYGGVRFEDYQTIDESVSYFSTRIYAGLGVHL